MTKQSLPSGWQTRSLRQLNEGRITTLDPSKYPDETFEYFSIPAYQNGVIAEHTKGASILSNKLLIPPQCLLFGKLNPRVEKVWNVNSQAKERKLASTEWLPICPTNELQRDFGYFLLRSDWVMPIAQSLVSGSTPSRERVEPKSFYDIEVPLPPHNEQAQIAKVLDLFESSIKKQTQIIAAGSSLKRGAMRQLFARGLRDELQKDTVLGQVPQSWVTSTLGEVCSIERGRFLHRPRNEPRFYGGNMPFVQTGDVVKSDGRIRRYTQTLNEDGIGISRVFPAGTILITIAANIGYSGILEFDSACPDSLVALTPQRQVNNSFLQYYLQTQQLRMDELAPKGTQKNINVQFLKPWPVPIPSYDEQIEIAAVLDAVDKKIDLHKRKRAVLESLFKSLLHKLMSSEIRVSDLDLSALEQEGVAA